MRSGQALRLNTPIRLCASRTRARAPSVWRYRNLLRSLLRTPRARPGFPTAASHLTSTAALARVDRFVPVLRSPSDLAAIADSLLAGDGARDDFLSRHAVFAIAHCPTLAAALLADGAGARRLALRGLRSILADLGLQPPSDSDGGRVLHVADAKFAATVHGLAPASGKALVAQLSCRLLDMSAGAPRASDVPAPTHVMLASPGWRQLTDSLAADPAAAAPILLDAGLVSVQKLMAVGKLRSGQDPVHLAAGASHCLLFNALSTMLRRNAPPTCQCRSPRASTSPPPTAPRRPTYGRPALLPYSWCSFSQGRAHHLLAPSPGARPGYADPVLQSSQLTS